MGLFIPNKKMPQTCSECLMCYDYYSCMITGDKFYSGWFETFDCCAARHKNCPLQERPDDEGGAP